MALPAVVAGAAKFLGRAAAQGVAAKAAQGGDPEGGNKTTALVIGGALLLMVISVVALISSVVVGLGSIMPTGGTDEDGFDCSIFNYLLNDGDEGFIDDTPQDSINKHDIDASAVGLDVDITTDGVVFPLKGGPHLISSGFGKRVKPCATCSDMHNGIDIPLPPGNEVIAAAAGKVVTATYSDSGGNMMVVQHNEGGKTISTAYMHLQGFVSKVGDKVTKGQTIAKSGNTGASTTGAHLHFEVWMGTQSSLGINPSGWLEGASATLVDTPEIRLPPHLGMVFTSQREIDELIELCVVQPLPPSASAGDSNGMGAGAWGGHENGKIPSSEMTSIPFASIHLLRADATAALVRMNAEYKAKFGKNISITDAYRTYESQVRLKVQKPFLAATPGTSNHGWGLALDLGGGINNFGTAEHTWMFANAPRFGWVLPTWARAGGSKPEPWHFEYVGASSDDNADGTKPAGAKRIAKQQMIAYKWDDAQFTCLDKLWERESNWNYKAQNPYSSAYGIPQSLPGDKMASEGSDWRTNPATQIKWGLKYIKGRYGTPCFALAHSDAKNWY